MLGFINRASPEKALKSLHPYFVRSVLEYNSIIWSHFTLDLARSIERIQH